MNDVRYEEVAGNAETQALDGIWSQLGYDLPGFSERKELFLHVLDRLLREERIKLHKNGVFLQGSIEDQVARFRRAFPQTAAASGYEDFSWRFFDDDCPAASHGVRLPGLIKSRSNLTFLARSKSR